MPHAVSSEPFRALAAALREGGFQSQGARLDAVLSGTFTTSSELIGELGSAVVAIRRQCAPLSRAQRSLIRQCLKEVRKTWPGFGWLDWLRFRR